MTSIIDEHKEVREPYGRIDGDRVFSCLPMTMISCLPTGCSMRSFSVCATLQVRPCAWTFDLGPKEKFKEICPWNLLWKVLSHESLISRVRMSLNVPEILAFPPQVAGVTSPMK